MSIELRERLVELETQKQELEGSGRYCIINDATIEALGKIQKTNPGGVIVYNDELATLIKKLDQPESVDRPQYLEMHDGNVPSYGARIGRGEINILSRTLTIIGGIQPSVLAKTIEDATSPELGRADGLLQRFQMMVMPNPKRNFKAHDVKTTPPAELTELFNWIDEALPSQVIDNEWEPLIFYGDDAAYKFWIDWVEKHDERVNKIKEDYLSAHLTKQRALLTGLALTFALIRKSDHVGLEDMERAAGWCKYLELHARKIYTGVSGSNDILNKIADKIKSRDIIDGDTVTSVKRKKYGTSQEIDAAIKELEDSNWIRIEKGAKQSKIIRISPHIELDKVK